MLDKPSGGLQVVNYTRNETLFRQGDVADAIYYIVDGTLMFSTVARGGKEAVISVRGRGEVIGQNVLTGRRHREYTATALSSGTATRIELSSALRLIDSNPHFTKFLLASCIVKNRGSQEMVVDHIVHNSEIRLARLLLRLADTNDPDNEPGAIPQVSQEILAQMIGTTRGRVNIFLNRLRRDGLIEWETPIRVHRPRVKRLLQQY